MGIGFRPETEEPALILPDEKELDVPTEFGLSLRQMAALGMAGEGRERTAEPAPGTLSARAWYGGDEGRLNVEAYSRIETKMAASSSIPGQAPPDLPSLLLDGRICYIGMALVPAVTELLISELLWLNYSAPEKPIYVYINSMGSQTPDGQAVGFETEATAIVDTMSYIRPEIQTLAVGQAFGNACLILASGQKGKRFALPHARIMTAPPRMNRSFGSITNMMIKANELEVATDTYVEMLVKFTGKEEEEVRKDISRNRYYTPEEAVDYGLVDRVVQPDDPVAFEAKDYEALLQKAQAAQGGRRPVGATAAEAGY